MIRVRALGRAIGMVFAALAVFFLPAGHASAVPAAPPDLTAPAAGQSEENNGPPALSSTCLKDFPNLLEKTASLNASKDILNNPAVCKAYSELLKRYTDPGSCTQGNGNANLTVSKNDAITGLNPEFALKLSVLFQQPEMASIRITSAYRAATCKGGANNSSHKIGCAIDLSISKNPCDKTCKWIKSHSSTSGIAIPAGADCHYGADFPNECNHVEPTNAAGCKARGSGPIGSGKPESPPSNPRFTSGLVGATTQCMINNVLQTCTIISTDPLVLIPTNVDCKQDSNIFGSLLGSGSTKPGCSSSGSNSEMGNLMKMMMGQQLGQSLGKALGGLFGGSEDSKKTQPTPAALPPAPLPVATTPTTPVSTTGSSTIDTLISALNNPTVTTATTTSSTTVLTVGSSTVGEVVPTSVPPAGTSTSTIAATTTIGSPTSTTTVSGVKISEATSTVQGIIDSLSATIASLKNFLASLLGLGR